jgi:hypothetical protein
LKTKIEKYKKVEKFIEQFDKKLKDEVEEEKTEKTNNIQLPKNKEKKVDKFLGQKRKTKEEYEKEIADKRNKRKKTYRNLNKKNPKGQPVMKYQVNHLLSKITDKIKKGII